MSTYITAAMFAPANFAMLVAASTTVFDIGVGGVWLRPADCRYRATIFAALSTRTQEPSAIRDRQPTRMMVSAGHRFRMKQSVEGNAVHDLGL
jgi:hypothetical protein